MIGQGLDPLKIKVKFILEPASDGCISDIGWVRCLAQTIVAMDRGHKHTNGVFEVAIWLSHARASPVSELAPEDAAVTQLDVSIAASGAANSSNDRLPSNIASNAVTTNDSEAVFADKFDAGLCEVLSDILDSYQDRLSTSFSGLGVIPLDSASLPRRQLETQLHSQMKDVMNSHPGLQQFTSYERFVPLLDKVLDEKVPAMMGHMLASAASASADDAVSLGALPSS